MSNKLKFSIVTTCKNSENYIEETVYSVINQKIFQQDKAELEYFIIDGASNDHTLNILEKIKVNHKNIHIISEPDNGMYEGLTKGFNKISGDIVAYINAGDFYNLTAFNIVANIFEHNYNVKWLTGEKFLYNNESEIINSYIPYKYRSNLIQSAVYGKYLPFIQQESTFWKKEIMSEVDLNELKKFKLAGDYYIWNCFSKKYQIYILKSYLAGFKYHPNQISFKDNLFKEPYFNETKLFKKKVGVKEIICILLDGPGWLLLTFTRKINFSRQFYFDTIENRWTSSHNQSANFIYAWATDFSSNTGEGLLARKYLENTNENYLVFNTNQRFAYKDNEFFPNTADEKGQINFNFFKRYIVPLIGIFYLWYQFLRGKKVAYLNFLPLWNTLLIALLPPGTKFGPITGSIFKDKVNNFQSFVRKFIVPILYYINARILLFRKMPTYIFSTNLMKKFLPNKILKKSKFNFVYTNVNLKKQIPLKKIDILIYYRDYFTKSNNFYKNLIKRLEEEKNINIQYIGDRIHNLDKNYKGRLSHKDTLDLIEISKFSIVSEENFSSLFTLECIENHLDLFASEKVSVPKKILDTKKIHIINYENTNNSINYIIEKIRTTPELKKFTEQSVSVD